MGFCLVHPAWVLSADAAEDWTLYENERFGYEVEYPYVLSNVVLEPDNGDGVELASEDGNYRLTISGGYNVLEDDAEAALERRLEETSHLGRLRDTFGDGWYRAVFADDGGKDGNVRLYHEYGVIDEDNWASFILVYPKDEENRFAEITARMEKSLALPQPDEQSEGAGAEGTGIFSIRDGGVFKGGAEVACEVYNMSEMLSEVLPDGFDNGIEYWAVMGPDASDAVTEAETGVWFFGHEGEFAHFIPLESAYEYVDIAWSPAGDRLVLVTGSGIRPDVLFNLYTLPGPEKKAEFPGLRDGLWWLEDGMRLAFTRIDGVRDKGGFDNLGYGLKLSAVLYDSAVGEETVLKEATDTQSFLFRAIGDEDIEIAEEYVESPEDWGDDEKIKEREIKVPVPAAG